MDKFKKFDRVVVTSQKSDNYKMIGQVRSIHKFKSNGVKFYNVIFGAGNEIEYHNFSGRELRLLPQPKKSHILTDIFK